MFKVSNWYSDYGCLGLFLFAILVLVLWLTEIGILVWIWNWLGVSVLGLPVMNFGKMIVLKILVTLIFPTNYGGSSK